ncbi:MAG: ribosomal protein [Chloroflexi bacterium]|nr:ribosomal protein [Chloroflexota bacterium]
MRHLRSGKKLSRPTNQRVALYRSLVGALFLHDRITTTEAKAKAIRATAEKLITLARQPSVHHRRIAFSDLPDKHAIERLFTNIGPRMKGRPGGYTRIVKLGPRMGDAAPMAIIELVE